MKTKLIKQAALLLLLSTLNPQLSTVFAQGTTFTYQGRLNVAGNHGNSGFHGGNPNDSASPANGTNYGMIFALYDSPTNGNLLGKLQISSVAVSNGLFTVSLDFGTNFS